MSETILVCNEKKHDELIEVFSPSIGRAYLYLDLGYNVVGGQIIGEFFCLGKRYILKVSEQCEGKVIKIKNNNRFIELAYGESFLSIDPTDYNNKKKVSSKRKLEETNKEHKTFINSPMDGMFYLSSSPQSPPFVQVGDTIANGQTLGLIEVMKCFYPLKYSEDKTVKIVSINIKNATPVICGMQIFTIADADID